MARPPKRPKRWPTSPVEPTPTPVEPVPDPVPDPAPAPVDPAPGGVILTEMSAAVLTETADRLALEA